MPNCEKLAVHMPSNGGIAMTLPRPRDAVRLRPFGGTRSSLFVFDIEIFVAQEMVQDVPGSLRFNDEQGKAQGGDLRRLLPKCYTATAIADFAVRARPSASVAVPLEWKELGKLRSANQFTITEVLKRFKKLPP
jgi:bifunctional non-homologous end joining protein LigD